MLVPFIFLGFLEPRMQYKALDTLGKCSFGLYLKLDTHIRSTPSSQLISKFLLLHCCGSLDNQLTSSNMGPSSFWKGAIGVDSTSTSWCVVWVGWCMHGRYSDGGDLLPSPHPPLLFPDFSSCSCYFCLSQTFSVRLSSHGTLTFCICVGFFLVLHPRLQQTSWPASEVLTQC